MEILKELLQVEENQLLPPCAGGGEGGRGGVGGPLSQQDHNDNSLICSPTQNCP